MKQLALVLLCLGQGAVAGPQFADRSDALPHHVYGGGWAHFVGGGVAVLDCNADGLPDLFAAGGENSAMLAINTGHFTFRSGALPDLRDVTGAYPIDIDADGNTDLFVLRAGKNVALRGQGDCTFVDATAHWGLPTDDSWSTAFTAWWEDGVTGPIMAIGNYVDRDDPDGPFEACDDNAVLRPTTDGYTAEVLSPGFCPLSILAAEDARGRLSLRLSNDRHYFVKGGFEQMWDIAERRFLSAEDGWPEVALWGMGIASRDLTGDRRDEVMLTSMGDQVLQVAQQDGSYRAAPYEIGTYAQQPHTGGDGRPSTGWHAEFGDIDNDGRADLLITKGNVDQMPGMATRDPNNLLMQQPDGRFVEMAEAAGIATLDRSRGGALADFDGDGRLDIVIVNRRAPMELYQNLTPDTGHWLRIRLQQTGGNRHGVGARVSVRTAAGEQSIQNVIGGGHAGGQALPLHFGLGGAEIAQVQVRWPDGSETIATLGAGETHLIEKP